MPIGLHRVCVDRGTVTIQCAQNVVLPDAQAPLNSWVYRAEYRFEKHFQSPRIPTDYMRSAKGLGLVSGSFCMRYRAPFSFALATGRDRPAESDGESSDE